MNARIVWSMEAGAYLFAFAVIVLMGAANLYYPFGPDQALFSYGAQQLDKGAVYYADYWDNKQPGIYWFYLAAGRLFGFSESRIHLFELIWMLAFSAVLMATLRGAFRNKWLSAFVPVATVGVYYGMSGEAELTQLEFIVAFPLFAFFLCLVWAQRSPQWLAALFFASGLLAGIAVVFKLLLAVLCMVLWLVALMYLWRGNRMSVGALLLKAVLPATAGVVAVLGSVVLLYHWSGHLDDLLWTAFVYPPKALASSPPASVTRLATAASFYISGVAPWALFAVIAIVQWIRRDRDLFGALLVTWIVVGAGLFLVQRFSWWYYHTLLVLLPVGLFAVVGVDRLCAWLNDGNRIGTARQAMIGAVVILTATAGLADDFVRKARPMLSEVAVQKTGARAYQVQISEHYRVMLKGARFLRSPDALPGPIYAFGHAIVHELSGRRSPHRTVGWSWKWFLPEQIDDILATLDRERVPYVFVDRINHELARLQPRVSIYLENTYMRHHNDESGQWYIRRELKDQVRRQLPVR